MAATNQSAKTGMVDSRWGWLYKTSGMAALLAGVLFLTAVADLIITGLGSGSLPAWISPFENNWLVIIFKLHAGAGGVQIDKLQVFNFLDLAILALVGLTQLGLFAALFRTSKIWSFIALIQPFLGIVLFVATRSAGRSSVMGAGLIISAVMLRGKPFSKVSAYIGLVASALLLAGDLSAGAIPPSNLVATLFGIGYVLLIVWIFLVARRLFQMGES
jgi:hypothetical protein